MSFLDSSIKKVLSNMALLKLALLLPVMLLVLVPTYALPAYSVSSCQCVAFRLDDVQDYWLDSVQTKLIDTFQQENASLTIGIIGNHIGQDSKLVGDIKSKIGKSPQLEIANHGWNHEDFTQFSREQQNMFMKNTNDVIYNVFGSVPSTFIPPFNTVNSDTMIAFLENNFQYISADVSQDTPSLLVNNSRIYHIPGNAQTSNLTNNDNVWRPYADSHLLVTVMSDIQKYGYAIVILHPPEYALKIHSHYVNEVDKNQIKSLELLIENMKNSGIKVTSINQIPSHMNSKPYPNWLNRVFSWNEKGMMSDQEVLSNINYLIDKNIIHSNSD